MSLIVLARPAKAESVLFAKFKGDFSVWRLGWVGDPNSNYSYGFGNGRGNGLSLWADNGRDGNFGNFLETVLAPWMNSPGVDAVALIFVKDDDHGKHLDGSSGRYGKPGGFEFPGKEKNGNGAPVNGRW